MLDAAECLVVCFRGSGEELLLPGMLDELYTESERSRISAGGEQYGAGLVVPVYGRPIRDAKGSGPYMGFEHDIDLA